MDGNYKPNSHVYKEQEAQKEAERKHLDKVTEGQVVQRKRSKANKLRDVFLLGDMRQVREYVLGDILLPMAKRAISEAVSTGVNMLLGEGVRDNRSNVPASSVSYRQYGSYYRGSNDRRAETRSWSQPGYQYDDIIFASRGDAEEVLYRMDEVLRDREVVSVADMFDMAGISCDYTANKYGWTDLRGSRVDRVRDGFVLHLPRVTAL